MYAQSDVLISEDMLAHPLNITDLNMRVGFFQTRKLTKLTSGSGEPVALPTDIGRFELLNIVQNRSDTSVSYQRLPLVSCSHSLTPDDNLFCARQNETMQVFGNFFSDQLSVWILQFRPCITEKES